MPITDPYRPAKTPYLVINLTIILYSGIAMTPEDHYVLVDTHDISVSAGNIK